MKNKLLILLCSFSVVCSCSKTNVSESESKLPGSSNDNQSSLVSESEETSSPEIVKEIYAKTYSNSDIVYIFGYVGEENFDLTTIDHSFQTNKSFTYSIDSNVATISNNMLSFKEKGVGIVTASNNEQTFKYVVIVNDSLENKYNYPNDLNLSNYSLKNGKNANIITDVNSVTINSINSTEWTRITYDIPEYLNNDYTIEADLSFLELKNNDYSRWAGIVFKDTEESTKKYPYYQFDIRNNPNLSNGVELTYVTNVTTYPFIGSFEGGHRLELNEKIHMKLVTSNNNVIGYLNDVQVFETTIPTNIAGNIGFQAGGANVKFENIKLSYSNARRVISNVESESSKVNVKPSSSSMKPNIIASGANLDEIWGVGSNVQQLFVKVKKQNDDILIYDSNNNLMDESLTTLLSFNKGTYIPNIEVTTYEDFEIIYRILSSLGINDYTIWSANDLTLKEISKENSAIRLGYISSTNDLSTPSLVAKECITAGSSNAYLILVDHKLLNKDNVLYFTGRGYTVVANASDGEDGAVIDSALDGCSLILTRFSLQVAKEVEMLDDNSIFNVDTHNSIYSMFSAPYATGHRGAGNTGTNPDCSAIENTFPSFDWAYDNGAFALEIDVHMLNGKLVVKHDTPNSTESLPLLDEVFEKYNDEKYFDKTLVIEVKDNLYTTGVAIIEKAKEMNWYGRFVLITFDISTASKLHKYDPAVPVGYLGGVDFKTVDDYWNTYNGFFAQGVILSANQAYMNQEAINQANARGQLCWEWTFDSSSSSKLATNIINGNKCFTTNYIQAMTYNYYKLSSDTILQLGKNETLALKAKAVNYKKETIDIENPEIILISGNANINGNSITKLDDGEIKICLKYKQAWKMSSSISQDFYIYSDVITIK